MARITSLHDVGRGGGDDFLPSWKEKGQIDLIMHPAIGFQRRTHGWRRVERKKDGEEKISFDRFICWQGDDEEFHRRFYNDRTLMAPDCPSCRLVAYLTERRDIPDDAVLFRFDIGRDPLKIYKDRFLGSDENNWKDTHVPKTDVLMTVIPLALDPPAVKLTDERWSVLQALRRRMDKDIERYGADEGDPHKTPRAYTFEFDEKVRRYSVHSLPEQQVSQQQREAWEGPAPDGEIYCKPGDPRMLRDSMERFASDKLEIDWDLIFGPSLKIWGKRGGRSTTSREDRDDDRGESRTRGRRDERDRDDDVDDDRPRSRGQIDDSARTRGRNEDRDDRGRGDDRVRARERDDDDRGKRKDERDDDRPRSRGRSDDSARTRGRDEDRDDRGRDDDDRGSKRNDDDRDRDNDRKRKEDNRDDDSDRPRSRGRGDDRRDDDDRGKRKDERDDDRPRSRGRDDDRDDRRDDTRDRERSRSKPRERDDRDRDPDQRERAAPAEPAAEKSKTRAKKPKAEKPAELDVELCPQCKAVWTPGKDFCDSCGIVVDAPAATRAPAAKADREPGSDDDAFGGDDGDARVLKGDVPW